VVYSAVDLDLFSPGEPPADNHAPRILFVGHLSGFKGFNALVDAVLKLRGEFPKILLRAIGGGIEEDDAVHAKRKIAAQRAEENFDIRTGVPYEQLPQHYRWCDFFAGPTKFEGGPGNVYLEAMSCGKPVIACNSGGTPEAVLDRQTGILVPPASLDALCDAIKELACDTRMRKNFGDNGRDWVKKQFALDHYLDRVESLYEQLLGRSA